MMSLVVLDSLGIHVSRCFQTMLQGCAVLVTSIVSCKGTGGAHDFTHTHIGAHTKTPATATTAERHGSELMIEGAFKLAAQEAMGQEALRRLQSVNKKNEERRKPCFLLSPRGRFGGSSIRL